jgi:pyridoxine kinase
MSRQKRVAAIHDISCAGRCSLTVALPVISAAGIETDIIPTAVLSTHTGGFNGYTFRNLTDDILPIAEHWNSLGIQFDAIYTGYLGSFRQLDIMRHVFDLLALDDTLVVIDPVMGDSGRLYSAFDETFPAGMRRLCNRADLIVPNMTEAAFMLGEPYAEPPYTREFIRGMLYRLADLGADKIVLTGVSFDSDTVGAACFDVSDGSFYYANGPRIEGFYHGTGDVFASTLTAALISGCNLANSVQTAVDFTVGCVRRTHDAGTDTRYGVDFESGLCGLKDMILSKL